MFLFVRLDTFAVGCIVTERTGKRVEENANVSFFESQPNRQPCEHWFAACYLLILTEIVGGFWGVTGHPVVD